jgi:hypothetical protein
MNSEDISKYYHCFALLSEDFKGDGQFYRYLQKSLTKTIKTFDSGHIRYMFTNFERSHLNTGVKGRVSDHLKKLMDKKLMKGFDVRYIYDQTKDMKDAEGKLHEIPFVCRIYLEKVKYFN